VYEFNVPKISEDDIMRRRSITGFKRYNKADINAKLDKTVIKS